MTFNTLNKVAYGIADSYVHTKLCMELSRRTPMVAVPVISTNLGFHPILASSFAILRDAGVVFLDPRTGDDYTEPYPPGHDHELAAGFDPGWILERARRVRG
jgi:phosphopantothenoylcysteine synthetase/decarboxylase